MNKEVLLSNLEKIHSTEMGIMRIRKNLQLTDEDVIDFCKGLIKNNKSNIYKKGKNWYIEFDDMRLTINSYSYTIITAHKIRGVVK